MAASIAGKQAQAPPRPHRDCTLTIASAASRLGANAFTLSLVMCDVVTLFTDVCRHFGAEDACCALTDAQLILSGETPCIHQQLIFCPQMKLPSVMICKLHEKNLSDTPRSA
jgi:hypothetical protein